MRWVGGATAVLSLIVGLYQAAHLLSDARERIHRTDELVRVAKTQQAAADYEQAWTTLEQAAVAAEAGGLLAKLTGRLGETRRQVRQSQEDLAMAWLEDVRLREGQTFSTVVDKTVPVLSRGIANVTGMRKADMLAHVGWGYFLKGRDGGRQPDPEQWYRQAVDIDSVNPYAHAYRGHWTLWRGGAVDTARQDFTAALASGRATQHVRTIQLAALRNQASADSDVEILTIVNAMRRNGEPIESGVRSELSIIYDLAFRDDNRLKRLLAAVPAAEQLATLETLFGAESNEGRRWVQQALRAMLQEAAGHPDDALRTWQALRAELPASAARPLLARADAAIDRLGRRSR